MTKYILGVLIGYCMLFTATIDADELEQSKMLGLRTTIYVFENLAVGKAWYSKAFATEPYFDEPYYVGFNIRGFELGLMPQSKNTVKGTNVIAYWGVANLEQEYQRLLKLGAKPHTPISEVGGGIKLATVIDPFGNVLGLIYNPSFKIE